MTGLATLSSDEFPLHGREFLILGIQGEESRDLARFSTVRHGMIFALLCMLAGRKICYLNGTPHYLRPHDETENGHDRW
jgi:hypothetical protein